MIVVATIFISQIKIVTIKPRATVWNENNEAYGGDVDKSSNMGGCSVVEY